VPVAEPAFEPPVPEPVAEAAAPAPVVEPAAPDGGVAHDAPITELLPLAAVEPAPVPEPALSAAPPAPAPRRPMTRRQRAAPGSAAVATQLPRPERGGAAPPRGRVAAKPATRSGLLRPSIVLPALLVAIALLVALFVSGVFGADDPTPTSGSNLIPSAVTPPPAVPKKPEIVVVPGAEDASGAAVERAKKRARAASRRAAATAAPAATAATTAPPPPPPAAAAPPPPPAAAPKPASKPSSSSTPKAGIDANNGATGAEQLPPAQDATTVPELTPPPDPVLDPPGQ
jgi:hypothetical protein